MRRYCFFCLIGQLALYKTIDLTLLPTYSRFWAAPLPTDAEWIRDLRSHACVQKAHVDGLTISDPGPVMTVIHRVAYLTWKDLSFHYSALDTFEVLSD